ncbi:MAG: sigma-70 family RNA polymerase sigma factor [Vicinamibacterales bacterium]|jgi:RNA polymerase sigma-70 factor (ECF subfamily)|nr:sigma-70 family RNA polymerase sigma factor [Vicinamibacterales bacterium]
MTQRGLREAATGDHRAGAETDLAAEVKRLLAGGRREEAAERFGAIIDRQQRRAARIAYHYLRDPAEVDEVVQDAFLKAFLHLPSFREDLFFELWFTRILVNACLDRLKAKARRARWLVPSDARDTLAADGPPSNDPSPEATLLAKERRTHLMAAIDRLPTRQRTAVILSHLEGGTAREVSVVMGLNESTVRVHLFRAVRKLRDLLDRDGWMARGRSAPDRTSRRAVRSEPSSLR